MAEEKLQAWAEQLQGELHFSASEKAEGMLHPFLKILEMSRPEYTGDAFVKLDRDEGITLDTFNDSWALVLPFVKGMRYVQELHAKETMFPPLYPSKLVVTEVSTKDQGLASYTAPGQENPEADDAIVFWVGNLLHQLHDTLHAYAKGEVGESSVKVKFPHSALDGERMTLEEAVFLAGVEEMDHMYRYKVPALKKEIDAKNMALIEAGAFSEDSPDRYKGHNALESAAALVEIKALRAYRAGELSPER